MVDRHSATSFYIGEGSPGPLEWFFLDGYTAHPFEACYTASLGENREFGCQLDVDGITDKECRVGSGNDGAPGAIGGAGGIGLLRPGSWLT